MQKIKDLRLKMDLSQQQLANVIGVSRQSISFYEIGIREPGIDVLSRIAIALDTTVDDLIEFKETHAKHSQSIYEMIQKEKDTKN